MNLRIPSNSLVVMIGASGSGKSTLAEKLFGADNIVATDACRRMLAAGKPDADLQQLSEGAFVLFYGWVRARLRHGLLTVADSTALKPDYRNALAQIAAEEHVKVTYVFVDTPYAQCLLNNAGRPESQRVPEGVIKRHHAQANRSRGWFRKADNVERVKWGEEATVTLTEATTGIDAKAVDVIGDVHGCLDELVELVEKLGYVRGGFTENAHAHYRHPEGRKLVFVGDLIDRGPEPYKVLDFVRLHVSTGDAHLVLSNHERKLRNYLSGRNVTIKPDFQKSLDSFPADADKLAIKKFLYSLRPYLNWSSPSGDKWVVAHAAFDPKFDGKIDKEIEEFCVYGPVNSVDPVTHVPDRINWWESYRPGPKVVYGHIITDDGKPRVANGTYGIDTGCVHGGSLTAIRLPEESFVSVPAKQTYYEKKAEATPADGAAAGLAILTTKRVTVRGLDGANQDIFVKDRGLCDAIDTLSTRTIRPDKLCWLAPTMSPGPVSEDPSAMEDPKTTAKWMFQHAPGSALVAQVKHMGSRGTWLCERKNGKWDVHCWTKNGYEMFDGARRAQVYEAIQPGLDAIAAKANSEVLLLDSEVMPFNQHGDAWLENTFMVTAAAGQVSRFAMARAAKQAKHDQLSQRYATRMENLRAYGDAANRFCWPVSGAEDVRIGFFDLLYPAFGGTHKEVVGMINTALSPWPIFRPTEWLEVVDTEESLANLMKWWAELTKVQGTEGVVLKYDNVGTWSASKYPQRMLKVRGADYLRLVYGPQYLDPEILPSLRAERRNESKMRMATQQTLLGLEAIRRRFVEGRSFESWHEAVLAILAAERATIDPRL